ncbi:MAG: hypothetical protein ABR887_05050 [Methanoregulaceae archaeon]|jgi:hypothetical protein
MRYVTLKKRLTKYANEHINKTVDFRVLAEKMGVPILALLEVTWILGYEQPKPFFCELVANPIPRKKSPSKIERIEKYIFTHPTEILQPQKISKNVNFTHREICRYLNLNGFQKNGSGWVKNQIYSNCSNRQIGERVQYK